MRCATPRASGGLRGVLAPVRPTLKERYPLIPIERYVTWRRDDGAHFDPWIRLHERVGGEILAPAPRSMVIEAPVADWEDWTAMRFPADGTYIVPGMLAPLEVRDGVGVHVEPNVWLRHIGSSAVHRPVTTARPSSGPDRPRGAANCGRGVRDPGAPRQRRADAAADGRCVADVGRARRRARGRPSSSSRTTSITPTRPGLRFEHALELAGETTVVVEAKCFPA